MKINRNLPINLNKNDLHLFQHELEKHFSIPEIIVLQNVIVDGQGNYNTSCSELTWTGLSDAISMIDKFSSLKESIKVKLNINTIQLENACWISDQWSTNYFHWTCDCMSKLVYIEKYYPKHIVLLPENLLALSFVQFSLKRFNLKYRAVKLYEKVKVSSYFMMKNLAPTGNYIPKIIEDLQNKIRLNSVEVNRKIFVQRTGQLQRQILNQGNLTSILREEKFEIVDIDKMNWLQQANLFSSTRILVGVHGAALTNMIFMPSDGKVLEFRKIDDAHNNCYFSLAAAAKLEYYYQLCRVDRPELSTQENNFHVDKSLFKQNIQLVLRHV